MAAHLRPLPRCKCGKPATEELFNAVNAPSGRFCDRCAPKALKEFERRTGEV